MPLDMMIEEILPHLEKGDIIMRRQLALAGFQPPDEIPCRKGHSLHRNRRIRSEEGARTGPSILPAATLRPVAPCEGNLSGDRRQGKRMALLACDWGGARMGGALRENGAQTASSMATATDLRKPTNC